MLAAVVALLGLTSVATAGLGAAYAARAAAHNAADAAALAAVVATYPGAGRASPVAEAGRVALANDAVLVSCACQLDSSLDKRTTTVVVGVLAALPVFGSLEITAASSAEFDPRSWLGR